MTTFKFGDYVKLTKMGPVSDPQYRTPNWEDYEPGAINEDKSLPLGYWVTGKLGSEPAVDTRLLVFRDCRNGERIDGELLTSKIMALDTGVKKLRFYTENSVYLLEHAEKQDG
jgi:hypothetical protein